VKDEEFIRVFKGHSAAKTVHHGFAGGLLEHTLSVVKMCRYFADTYEIDGLPKTAIWAEAFD
jgi:3'-5' exoribonuclease